MISLFHFLLECSTSNTVTTVSSSMFFNHVFYLVLVAPRDAWARYDLAWLRLPSPVNTRQPYTGLGGLRRQVNPKRREDTVTKSTCGYETGDPTKPRSAEIGYACRVDTKNALWGFCPQTVIQASDCGLAGACVDIHDCHSVCGISDDSAITTFSWYEDIWSDLRSRRVPPVMTRADPSSHPSQHRQGAGFLLNCPLDRRT